MQQSTLFESRTQNYHTYRIPALAVSPQGTILAFCEARKHNGRDDDTIDILLRRSFDNGQTWQPRQLIVADGQRTCGNPCPVIDQSKGTILLPFCKDNQQIFLTSSNDDGVTWTQAREISDQARDPAWSYVGTGPGHGIQLLNGRLLLPCWADESPGPVTWAPQEANWGKIQSSYALFSDDSGTTWQHSGTLDHDQSDECEVVELANGQVYMTVRSRHNKKRRGFTRSDDNGTTWSPIQFDDTLPEPSCQASIIRYDDTRTILAHPAHPEERRQLTLRLSSDNGHTWPQARVLYPGLAAYSDLAVTPDHHILCFYEADNYSRLLVDRFSLEWLEEED